MFISGSSVPSSTSSFLLLLQSLIPEGIKTLPIDVDLLLRKRLDFYLVCNPLLSQRTYYFLMLFLISLHPKSFSSFSSYCHYFSSSVFLCPRKALKEIIFFLLLKNSFIESVRFGGWRIIGMAVNEGFLCMLETAWEFSLNPSNARELEENLESSIGQRRSRIGDQRTDKGVSRAQGAPRRNGKTAHWGLTTTPGNRWIVRNT